MEGSERLRRAILPWSMVTGEGRGRGGGQVTDTTQNRIYTRGAPHKGCTVEFITMYSFCMLEQSQFNDYNHPEGAWTTPHLRQS